MEAIELEMEALRGLDERQPITRTLMTRQELAAYLEQDFDEDYPPEEIARDTRVLEAFDFVPENFDLRRALLELYSSQVLGLYDDEADTFYIVSAGEFELMDRLTFAHEYVHGLQDQVFDLNTFVDEDLLGDDEVLARMALVEGDASLAMTEYLLAHVAELSAEEMASLMETGTSESDALLEAAPPILRETLLFPYIYGQEFVTVLQEEGWQAVDAAYADPPRSTEQILHPDKYLDDDEPQAIGLPPLADTLGSGWALVESETLGEFQTNLYLVQQVDEATARTASQGWDGDRYALYARDTDEVLVFATIWDSEIDGEEFVDAYRQYAEARYRRVADATGEQQMWWQDPDRVTVLAWEGERAVVVVAPSVETAEQVLAVVKP
jgi:hypothetical protein